MSTPRHQTRRQLRRRHDSETFRALTNHCVYICKYTQKEKKRTRTLSSYPNTNTHTLSLSLSFSFSLRRYKYTRSIHSRASRASSPPPQKPSTEREDLFKSQQERERTYSKASKREREDLFKIQQERERGGIQNPATEKERGVIQKPAREKLSEAFQFARTRERERERERERDMPRLSSYSERIEQGIAESKLRQKQQLKRKAGGGKGDEEEEDEWSAGADGSRGRRGERGRQQQQQQFGSSVVAPPRTGKNGNASLALRQLERERESFETVLADNRTKMERKMKTLGGGAQTLYRQPDGTLGPQKPPRNPYTVAARKQFADLVHYCRITGGDEEYTKTSKSYRYNIGTGDTHAESSLYRQFPAHETETSHTSPVEFRHAFRHHTETRSAFRQYTHTHTHTQTPTSLRVCSLVHHFCLCAPSVACVLFSPSRNEIRNARNRCSLRRPRAIPRVAQHGAGGRCTRELDRLRQEV